MAYYYRRENDELLFEDEYRDLTHNWRFILGTRLDIPMTSFEPAKYPTHA